MIKTLLFLATTAILATSESTPNLRYGPDGDLLCQLVDFEIDNAMIKIIRFSAHPLKQEWYRRNGFQITAEFSVSTATSSEATKWIRTPKLKIQIENERIPFTFTVVDVQQHLADPKNTICLRHAQYPWYNTGL